MNLGIYFGQLVIGPAGSGKVLLAHMQSTYCKTMQEMAQTLKRNIVIFNLDPAAQYNEYRCDVDIKDLITLEDVMEEMELGPNGGLLFCMEYLLQNQSWLQDKLNEFVGNDDYVIFDCPGQIELYSDQDIFREIVRLLQNYGFSIVSMYMMDINFISDQTKFVSGMLQALSTQLALELPSITVLTKCDLIKNQHILDKYLNYFSSEYQEEQFVEDMISTHSQTPPTRKMFVQLKTIINSNNVVSLSTLNLDDQDSIRELLFEADNSIQYGQNLETDDKLYEKAEAAMNQQ